MQVDFVTAHLASAHIPLATLVFGLQTDLDTPGAKQVISCLGLILCQNLES